MMPQKHWKEYVQTSAKSRIKGDIMHFFSVSILKNEKGMKAKINFKKIEKMIK